ncbi:VRR-NUC domain-containing protein [Catalinimonas niigatensis]|uniref:VRR-NUC domain-containing protein n=1 Tax=Catalinimonas niigatensis TaxID=1397264 RepID=UPI002666FE04|nr:VRR-NUC domain-containing protein [Catalinimonas niigatensis]WPP49531.1 VRR-NUC domain-containing protein [Catalinimonas niigatensis]
MKPPPIELPEKYYLDYFRMLLEHVQTQYAKILSPSEKSFIRSFHKLGEDAQCLFIRLVNRRGVFFRMNKIQYQEVEHPEAALQLLLRRKYFTKLNTSHVDELVWVLHIFTKPELLLLIKPILEKQQFSQLRKLKKPELIEVLIQLIPTADLIKLIQDQELIIRVEKDNELEMFKFLYFGHLDGDMTQFVVRDIGYIKTEAYDQSKLKALFKTRQEAEDKLKICKVYREFKCMRDELMLTADLIYEWFERLDLKRENLSELALAQYDKLCLRLGKMLEQQNFLKLALNVYQHTDHPPARERRVRLLHKLGLLEEALSQCQLMQKAPANAEERFFAEDFCNRIQKKKRTRKVTDYLKNSRCITLGDEHKAYVEQGVLIYLQEKGQMGVHTENYLWRGMFGLLLWDIIFDQDSEAFHHPLQTVPSDFYTPLFLEKRNGALLQRMKVLSHPKRFYNIVRHHFESKMGMSNPIMGWHEDLLSLVERCYACLKPEQISNVLMEMAKNLKENTKGFPDLFVWDEQSYRFIEVKSPTDQLSAQQLYWLHFFEQQGISAEVIRVSWN